MVNIAHWRLLNDGRVVIVAFSEKFDDIKPPCDGHVRAEAILGGFLFTPCAEGTKIQYLVEVCHPNSTENIICMINLSCSQFCLIVD
jgi:hypothetical protein